MALRKAVFDRQILSLDVAGFAQSLAERGDERRERVVGGWAEDADHRHRVLLRAGGKRPSDRHAAKYDEQFAPFHQHTPKQAKAWPTRNLSHCAQRLAWVTAHCRSR